MSDDAEWLRRWMAAGAAGSPALFAPGGSVSRGALARRARGAAAALAPGQGCAVASDDPRVWLPWLLGCVLRGAIWESRETGRRQPPPARDTPVAGAPETAPCLKLGTSGSTGTAQALLRDAAGWRRCFDAEAGRLGLDNGDRVLVLGRPGFSLVPYAVLGAVHRGAPVGLLPHPGVAGMRRLLAALRPTLVYGAPPLVAALARRSPAAGEHAGPARVITGGTRLTPGQLAAIRRCWPRAEVVCFYGTAQTSFIALRSVADGDACAEVGTPLPGVEVLPCATGVRVRSPFAALARSGPGGVWRPLADAEGWITIADRIHWTDDGSLRVLGRLDAGVDAGGALLDPAPLEHALEALPWVTEAALVSVPDEGRSARAVAAVVAAAPPPGAAAALRRTLALAPAAIRVQRLLGSPPRTAGGKLHRGALAAALGRGELSVESLL